MIEIEETHEIIYIYVYISIEIRSEVVIECTLLGLESGEIGSGNSLR
jgi:hypothetical protein